ncbi:MAG: hypothetical protein ACQEP1_06485 [Nanobdellota archaeon]
MKKRGQTSVEAVIILAVIVLLFSFILSFREETVSDIRASHNSKVISVFIDKIVNKAENVYHQGAGASSIDYVKVPAGVEFIDFRNHSLVVRTELSGEQDRYRKTSFNLTGEVPVANSTTGYCLNFTSHIGHVSVGVYNGSC